MGILTGEATLQFLPPCKIKSQTNVGHSLHAILFVGQCQVLKFVVTLASYTPSGDF